MGYVLEQDVIRTDTNNNNGGAITIVNPTAGNLLVVCHSYWFTGAGLEVPAASGFTPRADAATAANQVQTALLDKIATGSEGTSITVTNGGVSHEHTTWFGEMSGMTATPFITGSAAENTSGTGTVASMNPGNIDTDTAGVADAVLVVAAGVFVDSAGMPTGFAASNSFVIENSAVGASAGDSGMAVAIKAVSVTSATHNTAITWTNACRSSGVGGAYAIEVATPPPDEMYRIQLPTDTSEFGNIVQGGTNTLVRNATAGINGEPGMRLTFNGTEATYAEVLFNAFAPASESVFTAGCHFDFSALSLSEAGTVTLMRALSAANNTRVAVGYRMLGSVPKITFLINDDAGNPQESIPVAVPTPAPQWIDIEVGRSTNASTEDGYARLYLDGELAIEILGFILYDNFDMAKVRTGALSQSGTISGTLDFGPLWGRSDGTRASSPNPRGEIVSPPDIVTIDAGVSLNLVGDATAGYLGGTLAHSWTFSEGSGVPEKTTESPGPTVFLNAGTHTVTYTLSDNAGRVDPVPESRTVTVNVVGEPPLADAGPNQTVAPGNVVQLDGSGSSDPDEDALTYLWALTLKPASSAAALSSTTVANPTFTADLPGLYRASLVVNDGASNSPADTVDVLASLLEQDLSPLIISKSRVKSVPGDRRKPGSNETEATAIPTVWMYPKDDYDVVVNWEGNQILPVGGTSLTSLVVTVLNDQSPSILADSGMSGLLSWARLVGVTQGITYTLKFAQTFNNGVVLEKYVKVLVKNPRIDSPTPLWKYPNDAQPIPVYWAGNYPRGAVSLGAADVSAYNLVDEDVTGTYIEWDDAVGPYTIGQLIAGSGGDSVLIEFGQTFDNGRKFHEYALLTVRTPPS